MPEIGEKAPDFTLPSTRGPFHLGSTYLEKKVVVAFYAEDDTPSCAQELGAEVVAISVDSLESHQAFCDKAGDYPFPLASDEGREGGGHGLRGAERRREAESPRRLRP